jgi:hypothetical protein
MLSGLAIEHDLGEGHSLLGRRMPDLDLGAANDPLMIVDVGAWMGARCAPLQGWRPAPTAHCPLSAASPIMYVRNQQ